MAGWNPVWSSERMECSIDWHAGNEFGSSALATFRGETVGDGPVHGVLVWLEDGGQTLDPTDLPLTGCIVLRHAQELNSSGCSISVKLTALSPDDLTCAVSFHAAT